MFACVRFVVVLVAAMVMSAIASTHASAEPGPLLRAERAYADYLDADGAVSAIESGAMTQFERRGLREWRADRDRNRDLIIRYFKDLQRMHLKGNELRVWVSMQRGFADSAAAGGEEESPHGRCEDAVSPSLSGQPLRDAVYACFDSVGNRIEFGGGRITRVAAIQLLQELDEPAQRRALFYAMAALWRSVNANDAADSPYRRLIQPAAAAFGRGDSPVHAAARTLGITVPQAESWLVQVLDAWRIATDDAPAPIEPWDYLHRYAAASRALSQVLPKSTLLPLQQRFYRDLGADPARLGVLFDIDPRPGKAPLAYADTIRIGRIVGGVWRPAVSRVSANDDRGGLGVLNELVHESGHAVHYSAIRARPAFYWPDIAFIEAFADVPSWSVYSPEWQQKYLGVSVSRAEGLRELYAAVMLDAAWSLFEVRMLREPGTDPNGLWADITGRYLHIAQHPEMSWWATRSQLVTDPGYMINYGLGAFLTADIRAKIRHSMGAFDAGNPRWFEWTSEHLLRFGAELDAAALMQQFLGHPVSPAALVDDIESIGGSGGRAQR
jgi:hypothetical protein